MEKTTFVWFNFNNFIFNQCTAKKMSFLKNMLKIEKVFINKRVFWSVTKFKRPQISDSDIKLLQEFYDDSSIDRGMLWTSCILLQPYWPGHSYDLTVTAQGMCILFPKWCQYNTFQEIAVAFFSNASKISLAIKKVG